ncbi:MAG: DUF1571 domain-containing protein [Planctomycetota bacterium]
MKAVMIPATVTFSCVMFMAIISVRDSLAADPHNDNTRPAHSNLIDAGNKEDNGSAGRNRADNPEVSAIPSQDAELTDVMEFAKTAYARIDEDIDDYTCVLYKRERVDGKVLGWQSMAVKIRHQKMEGDELKVPFSVYMRFLAPSKVAGREVLYVENKNNGDLIARRGGRRSPNVTFQLIPESPLAMLDNRYPITEIGFKNLAKRLIEVLEQELDSGDGELKVWENAKIGDRECTHYRLTHDAPRPDLTYHMAEVSVDEELEIPIRYGAYDFPREEGGKPQVLEQYVYTQVRINVGLTDEDFDPDNPDYEFQLYDGLEDKLTQD